MPLIEILGIVAVVLAVVAVILLVVVVGRMARMDRVPLQARLDSLEKGQERGERESRDEFARNRNEAGKQMAALRVEIGSSLGGVAESIVRRIDGMTEANERKSDALRVTVEQKLAGIQANNDAKLEEMRRTVDEKLEATLEKRLGESFQIVGDRLEQVSRGLGEMQALAGGVGDLKKVLTNIKTRGTWGEIQLGNLLEQVLTPEQYARNVCTKTGSNERVEFAIKLPGRGGAGDPPVWLPIDAKFPKEDYERLVDASERADADGVEEAARQLEARIKQEARTIQEKYLDPPQTTDFGLLFLPTEGLYAEVLRRPGLADVLQREFRVSVAGPTTLAALLNSLQMGFRTLAIEQRSAEVRILLGAVKTEFGKFGDAIEKVHKKILDAGETIDKARTRSRAIERKLRSVEELPAADADRLLGGAEAAAGDGGADPAAASA